MTTSIFPFMTGQLFRHDRKWMWTDTAQVYNLHIFASRGGGDQPVHQEISAKHWDMMDFSPFFCIEKWNSLKKVFVGLGIFKYANWPKLRK